MTVEETHIQAAKEAFGSFWWWFLPLALGTFLVLLISCRKKISLLLAYQDSLFVRRWWGARLFLITVGAFALRIWHLDYTGLFIDESNHYLMARHITDQGKWSYFSGKRDFSGIDITAGIALVHLLTGGKNIELTARLPSVIFGSLAAIGIFGLVYLLSRSKTTALIAALLWALDPFSVFWSRYARFYISMAFWLFAALSALYFVLERRQWRFYLYYIFTTAGVIFSRGLVVLALPLFPLVNALRRRDTRLFFKAALTALVIFFLAAAYMSLVNIKDPYLTSVGLPSVKDTSNKLTALFYRLVVYIPNITPVTLSPGGIRLFQCAERFFWNNLAAVPWFMLAGLAGFLLLLILRGHYSSLRLPVLTLSLLAALVTYAVVTKCQIRMQWMIHIFWLIYAALFLGFLYAGWRGFTRRFRGTKTGRFLDGLALAVIAILGVGVLLNLGATKRIVLLKPGEPAPFYYYFSVSRKWVEDSRSPGLFVRQHLKENDLVITSMWQYLAYFLDKRNQFRGILLMNRKPSISAYVTGGEFFWRRKQVLDLLEEARRQGGGLWVIYDQAKELDPLLREQFFHARNLRYVGQDGKTQVYYLY
jgi:4-amino-4-deoxy-L-arabinose transferase-like glycosyltransferase